PVAQAQELYNGMGVLNGSHFSNYPPINQLCFLMAGLFSGKSILGSVVVMRLLIIAADFGTLYFGKKLLGTLKLPVYNIFWYILNPFIIIELTGNLHFEGIMVFFLVWSLYVLHIGKWKLAGILLGLSISVKLIPLIFLPLFYPYFTKTSLLNKKWFPDFSSVKKVFIFYVICCFTALITCMPFYNSGFLNNYLATIGL